MKKIFKAFTGKNLLLSLGISLAGYLIGPVLKELLNNSQEPKKDFYQFDEESQEIFLGNKEELN